MASIAQRLSAAGAGNALELRGVSRLFGALVALDDVTMSVRPGERRAVLGSNGAGKTTLFNAVTGDFPPQLRGDPFLRGGRDLVPAARADPPGPAAHLPDLVAVPRSDGARQRLPRLPRGLARALLAAASRRNEGLMQSAIELVEAVHLTGVRDRTVAELSYGEQRQLEIALALAGAPRFILFDERPRGSPRTSARSSSRSSIRSPRISATSSSSTTWTWRCGWPRACR